MALFTWSMSLRSIVLDEYWHDPYSACIIPDQKCSIKILGTDFTVTKSILVRDWQLTLNPEPRGPEP